MRPHRSRERCHKPGTLAPCTFAGALLRVGTPCTACLSFSTQRIWVGGRMACPLRQQQPALGAMRRPMALAAPQGQVWAVWGTCMSTRSTDCACARAAAALLLWQDSISSLGTCRLSPLEGWEGWRGGGWTQPFSKHAHKPLSLDYFLLPRAILVLQHVLLLDGWVALYSVFEFWSFILWCQMQATCDRRASRTSVSECRSVHTFGSTCSLL